jgi:competence protein ComEA
MRKPLLVLAMLAAMLAPAWTQTQKPENKGWDELLPPGDGRDAVLTACVTCHGLKAVVIGRKDRAGWQKTVDDMIQRGAPVFPEEIDPITAYLAKVFPAEMPSPINANTATAEELTKLPGVTPEVARRLIDARVKFGPFKSAEEMRQAVGLDKSEFEAIRYLLKFSE